MKIPFLKKASPFQICAAVGLFTCIPAFGDDIEVRPDWEKISMTGSWDGVRGKWYDRGIKVELSHSGDLVSNLSGGKHTGTTWLGHSDARISLDLEKMMGWKDSLAYLEFISDLGGKPNQHLVGSFMGIDNLETVSNTAQFFQAWVQKNLFGDKFSVLFGLYPIDSEFYVTDSSAVFIHPSYGMAAEVAQSACNGRFCNGPPIFNTSSLGARIKMTSPERSFYLMGALNDAVPGNPDHPYGTQVHLHNGEGTLSIVEFGYTPQETVQVDNNPPNDGGRINKTAIGVWHYSARYNDLQDFDKNGQPLKRHRQGAYLLLERTLFVENKNPDQGLAGFFRYGIANQDVHQADRSMSAGFSYRGWLQGRDDDVAGMAITWSHAGSSYRNVSHSASYEAVLEITYRAQIKPWLAIQPDFQYISHPNMDNALDDAKVLGIRLDLAL